MFIRFVVCTVLLTPFLPFAKDPFPRGELLAKLLGLGAVLYFGQSIAYFSAITLIPAGMASLLLYLYPAVVTVLAVTFLHERLTKVKGIALALALTGVALTVGSGGLGGGLNRTGVVLGVGSAACYALYIIVGSKLLERAPPLATSWIVFSTTAAVYGMLVLLTGAHWPQTGIGWAGAIGLGFFSTIAISTFLAGLRLIGPINSSTLSALEPVVTITLAAVLFNDRLGAPQLVGAAAILAAAIILARSAASGPSERPSQPPGPSASLG
jgi:drug/metabolite transporter (DMT)-like permease